MLEKYAAFIMMILGVVVSFEADGEDDVTVAPWTRRTTRPPSGVPRACVWEGANCLPGEFDCGEPFRCNREGKCAQYKCITETHPCYTDEDCCGSEGQYSVCRSGFCVKPNIPEERVQMHRRVNLINWRMESGFMVCGLVRETEQYSVADIVSLADAKPKLCLQRGMECQPAEWECEHGLKCIPVGFGLFWKCGEFSCALKGQECSSDEDYCTTGGNNFVCRGGSTKYNYKHTGVCDIPEPDDERRQLRRQDKLRMLKEKFRMVVCGATHSKYNFEVL